MANNQLTTKINKVSEVNVNTENQLNSYLNSLNKIQIPEENQEENNKMDIVTFIFLLICAGLLDLIDIIQFTGIGIPISVLSSLLIGFVFNVLLYFSCQKTNMKTATKLATTLGNYIIESIPAIDVLPINVIAVIICYILSNPEIMQKLASVSQKANKIASITSKVYPPAEPVAIATKAIGASSSVSNIPSNSNNFQPATTLSKEISVSPKIIRANKA